MKTNQISKLAVTFIAMFLFGFVFIAPQGVMGQGSTTTTIKVSGGTGPMIPESPSSQEFIQNVIFARYGSSGGNPSSFSFWNPVTNITIADIISTPEFGSWNGIYNSSEEESGNGLYFRYDIKSQTPFRFADISYNIVSPFSMESRSFGPNIYSYGMGIKYDQPGVITSLDDDLFTEVFGLFYMHSFAAYFDNGDTEQEAIENVEATFYRIFGNAPPITASVTLNGITDSEMIIVQSIPEPSTGLLTVFSGFVLLIYALCHKKK